MKFRGALRIRNVRWVHRAGFLALMVFGAGVARAGDQACCRINSDDRACFDDIIGSGLECPPGNGLGPGTTCAADCDCGETCGMCVGKQSGNLSTVEVQLIEPPVFNGTNTIYRYRVCQLSGRDLSHWSLGLPGACCSRIVSALSEHGRGTSCAVDPNTGLYGVKFETNGGVPQCQGDCGTAGEVFTITLSGNATTTGCMKIAAKADGGENTSTACLVGPNEACNGFCTSDSQCNDGYACTLDDCDPGNPLADANGCVHIPDSMQCDDSNLCTDDACVAGRGCVFTPDNTNNCRNNLFCDGVEVCQNGACVPGNPPCNDGIACTVDACDEASQSCTHTPNHTACSNGQYCDGQEVCDPASGCHPGTPVNCSDLNGPCAEGRCNEATQSCEPHPINDGQSCDDGLFCTEPDTCSQGACQGPPRDCSDGVGCTNDSCDEVANSCTHQANDSKCDDGLFCNGAETCQPGAPGASPTTGCLPGQGCGAECVCDEDADLCQGCATCDGCPPAPACRIRTCPGGVCTYTPAPPGTACGDDGVACTTDLCNENGECVHTPDDSLCTPDANPCTDTICHPTAGCIHVPDNTNICDDGLFCTINDHCEGGVCTGGPKSCDDQVSCTDDSCDEAGSRCINTPNDAHCPVSQSPCLSQICDATGGCTVIFHDGAVCNDELGCTIDDRCQAGNCAGTPKVCNDNIDCTHDACTEPTGECAFTPQHAMCADNNPCTDELCVPAIGCVITPDDTNSCADDVFCNGEEFCFEGKCQPGVPPCDDGVDCTINHCVELKKTCSHEPDNDFCSDGVFCNGVEICNRKKGCQAGIPPVCNDNNLCTADACDPATDRCTFTSDDHCDDGLFCNGVEICDPLVGCVPGTAPVCDDGIDCTLDLCNPQQNACEHIPDDTRCSDGLFCNGAEICDALTGCLPGTAPDCDDGIECTADFCDEDNDMCLHVPQINMCDNGIFCDGQEICDPVTGCETGPPPCEPGQVCDEPNSSCGECSPDTPCPLGPCGTPQTCVEGLCVPGTPDCNDDIPCTSDFCNPASNQCEHTPDDSVCNNQLFCDGMETCNPLTGCQPGTPVNCDDGVACTTDQCDETTGQCTHTPSDTFCNDGLFCNGTEVCHPTQGCLPGTPPNCNDGANCSVDTCNEVADQCDHACSTPQITCTNQEFECDNVGTFLPPVVNDPCSVNPVATCTDVITPGKLPQEYTVTRTCSFTNDCGGSATCDQVVKVRDTTPPQITCPPDKRFECDAIGDPGQPIVSDNCDPDPQVTVEVQTIVGDCTPPTAAGISPPPKLIKLNTYTASDGSATLAGGSVADGDTTGNAASCTQRIEIVDTHGPLILFCPVSVSGCEGEPLDFRPPDCNDACGTCSVLCTRSDGLPLGAPVPSGPLSIHCVSKDECENSSAPCDVTVTTDNCDHIPAVSQWGLVVLIQLLLITAKLRFRQFGTRAPR